jgi:hypothetical protein
VFYFVSIFASVSIYVYARLMLKIEQRMDDDYKRKSKRLDEKHMKQMKTLWNQFEAYQSKNEIHNSLRDAGIFVIP